MKSETQKAQELQECGWRQVETEATLYSFNKQCAEDVSVIVSVCEKGSGFVVVSSSEHRCSGPSEVIIATVTTIEAALEKTVECCQNWDKRTDCKVDLSKWKLISRPE